MSFPDGLARPRNGGKMSHLVAGELRRQIVRGQIAPGDTLPSEAELIKVLDVSRDTLREALRMLESESLIYIRRGRHGGAVVRRADLRAVARYVALLLQIRKATFDDVHEARLVLEQPAVALLSDHVSSGVLRRLTALYDLQSTQLSDPLSAVTAIKQFDQAVVELGENKTIAILSGVFRDIYAGEMYVRLTRGRSGSQVIGRLLACQAGFIESVRSGDRDTVSESWRDYLEETRGHIVGARKKAGPIDVTPFWRAEVASGRADLRTDKMATVISVELRARIAEGQLQSGDKLPGLPELAASFGVSRPTLREALRILERESLVDVRTGTRGGGRIRIPSTQTAAQLAGIVLESEQTTLGDVWEARTLTEPTLMGLVAERIDTPSLERLRSASQLLRAATNNTPLFTNLWTDAELLALGATGNPAITVAVEIIHWVREGCRTELTADALNLPWVERSNRRAQRRFDDMVSAATRSDAQGARDSWTDYVRYTAPFFQSLSDRLILDMLD